MKALSIRQSLARLIAIVFNGRAGRSVLSTMPPVAVIKHSLITGCDHSGCNYPEGDCSGECLN